jgi:ComF family protein
MDSATPLCAECQMEERAFDRAASYGLYVGPLRAAILQLKFRRREELGKLLGALLVPVWEAIGAATEGLVPVPLHASRKRERGFNQAELLARGLARKLAQRGKSVCIEAGFLTRTRPTAPQTGLSRAARRENVRGVFRVERPEKVRGRTVCLVDDVLTTGTTLSACASALKRAGATRVLALTLARATPQFPDLDSGVTLDPVDEVGCNRT